MQRRRIGTGAWLGALISLPVMGLLYLGNQLAGLPFVPFDLFDWLARVLPGNVVTAGIDTIVGAITFFGLGATDSTAKLMEQLLALGLHLLIGLLLGVLIAWPAGAQAQRALTLGGTVGLLLFALIAALELTTALGGQPLVVLLWLAILYGGWGVVVGSLLERLVQPAAPAPPRRAAPPAGRRTALVQIAGGAAGVALAAWGVGRFFGRQTVQSGAGQPLAALATPTAPTVATSAATAEATPTPGEPFAPAPGTRSELTDNADFYRIDINLTPPVVDRAEWVLETAGLFGNPRSLTLDDLMALPAVTQPITLSCISNRIGGDLISTSNWTGVRLRDLLEELGLQPAATELYIEATDGFYESVTMEDMLDPRTLLVYGMNGETLPTEHGFPLRIYIPNRYGMKQPKWITRMEAISEEGAGYWVERGWSETARPHIISIIDTVAQDAVTAAGAIPIGGIAWAGDRGIQRVEVQVDDTDWAEARLNKPPLSPLTWVQWRYDWPAADGEHTFRVRAVDGTGTLQIGEETGVRPDGATGYHTVTRSI